MEINYKQKRRYAEREDYTKDIEKIKSKVILCFFFSFKIQIQKHQILDKKKTPIKHNKEKKNEAKRLPTINEIDSSEFGEQKLKELETEFYDDFLLSTDLNTPTCHHNRRFWNNTEKSHRKIKCFETVGRRRINTQLTRFKVVAWAWFILWKTRWFYVVLNKQTNKYFRDWTLN